MTYDRAMVKPDLKRVIEANRKVTAANGKTRR
jgi:hypothetical protein